MIRQFLHLKFVFFWATFIIALEPQAQLRDPEPLANQGETTDYQHPLNAAQEPGFEPVAEPPPFQPYFTYDLGGSSGTFNGSSYLEAQLGLNWFLKEWVIWRNSIFYRTSALQPRLFGLDSNIRLQAQIGNRDLNLRLFGGPGARITTQGQVLPLIETGAVVRLGGIQIGGGARFILHKWVGDSETNDVMFFLIFGGSGRL